MPGFDRSRFVTLTDEEYEDIKCGICLGVLNSPLVTQCCQQSYCFDCINEWIKNSKTCPNCRKGLTKTKLIPPPRFSSNLIEKLDIYCDYKQMGCNQGLKLGQLSQHLKSCAFNPINKCSVCGEVKTEGHNCGQKLETIVVGLKEQIESLKAKIKGLEEEVKRLNKSNTKLRSELRRKNTQNMDLQNKFDKELKVKCDENQNLCSTVSQLESQTIDLKQQIESLHKQINDFNNQNHNFFTDNQKLKNENKELREYCDKYLNEKENNESLRQELAKVSEENKLLNEQNINALNESQKLKEENEELRKYQLNEQHMNQVIKSARDNINSPQIKLCKLSKISQINAFNKIKESINKYDSYEDIAANLRSDFADSKRRVFWNVMVFSQNCCHSFNSFNEDVIDVCFGLLRIKLISI